MKDRRLLGFHILVIALDPFDAVLVNGSFGLQFDFSLNLVAIVYRISPEGHGHDRVCIQVLPGLIEEVIRELQGLVVKRPEVGHVDQIGLAPG